LTKINFAADLRHSRITIFSLPLPTEMKKIFAFILAVLYLCTTTGMVLNVQYCMGKVSNIKVDNYSKTACKCGSSMKTSGCCSSELKVVKLQNAHNAIVPSFAFDTPVQILSSTFYSIAPALLAGQKDHVSIHGPPLVSSPPVYLKNCVFRI
jgi:hypothetical protein